MSKAIKVGRLAKCIERDKRKQPKIRSIAEADAEWAATTRPPPDARAAMSTAVNRTGGRKYVYADEAAEEKHWKALSARLEYETKSELLVPAADAREVVTERFAEVKAKLRALAHNCKQRITRLTVDEVEIIEKLVDEALEAIADEGLENGE